VSYTIDEVYGLAVIADTATPHPNHLAQGMRTATRHPVTFSQVVIA
jgi:hypothetical protein